MRREETRPCGTSSRARWSERHVCGEARCCATQRKPSLCAAGRCFRHRKILANRSSEIQYSSGRQPARTPSGMATLQELDIQYFGRSLRPGSPLYLKTVTDSEWGNSELKKDWDERHPILRWYHDYCVAQHASEKQPDGTYYAIPTGVVNCYLGLAYGLYLLHHNVELQSRLIERLKNRGNFQGAYYEIIIASCLIRAGFELTLEDTAVRLTERCWL